MLHCSAQCQLMIAESERILAVPKQARTLNKEMKNFAWSLRMSASCDNRDGNIRLILIPLPPYITTSGCSLSLVYLFRRVREQSWVGGYMVREGVCVDGHSDKVEREGRGRWKKEWSSERQKVWDVAEAVRGRRATDVKDTSLHAPAPACNLLSWAAVNCWIPPCGFLHSSLFHRSAGVGCAGAGACCLDTPAVATAAKSQDRSVCVFAGWCRCHGKNTAGWLFIRFPCLPTCWLTCCRRMYA